MGVWSFLDDRAKRGPHLYEKAGEKYFVLDTHTHFWDASPANWRPGAEQYAKGWIECFHAYQSLGPPELMTLEFEVRTLEAVLEPLGPGAVDLLGVSLPSRS